LIDIHAHLGVPGAALTASRADGFAGHQAGRRARYQNPLTAEYMRSVTGEWDRLLTDLDARLRRMDDAGVAVQVLSVNPGQYYYWAEPGAARELVGQVNEHLAGIVAARPDRFLGLGTVALQHPELAAVQLRQAITDFGLAGVQISTQADGRDLSAPELDPLWAAAEEHDAVVFIHPLGCPQLTERLAPAYLGNIIGQPLETTISTWSAPAGSWWAATTRSTWAPRGLRHWSLPSPASPRRSGRRSAPATPWPCWAVMAGGWPQLRHHRSREGPCALVYLCVPRRRNRADRRGARRHPVRVPLHRQAD